MVEYSIEYAIRELRRQGLQVECVSVQGPEGHTCTITSGDRQYWLSEKHLFHLIEHGKLNLEGIEELSRILERKDNTSRP